MTASQESTDAVAPQANPSGAFISYSRQDSAFVHRLHDALLARQVPVWVDWEGIPPSWDWLQQLYAAIEAASLFVFVISNHSLASRVCQQELDHALSCNKRIVPIMREDVGRAEIPSSLARLNWIFLRDGDDFDAGVMAVVQALRSDPEHVQTHTYLLQRAIDWEAKGRDKSVLLRGANLRRAEEWLAQAGERNPRPTALHNQFLLASRQAESGRLRLVMAVVLATLALTLALAGFALASRNTAVQQQHAAQAAREVAVARQLSAQSLALQHGAPDGIETSALLAVEALRRWPSYEADGTLRQEIPLLRRARLRIPIGFPFPVGSLAISPDHRYAAVAAMYRAGAVVFDLRTGKSLLSIPMGGADLVFSPDSRYLEAKAFDSTGNRYVLCSWDSQKDWAKACESILSIPGQMEFSANGGVALGVLDSPLKSTRSKVAIYRRVNDSWGLQALLPSASFASVSASDNGDYVAFTAANASGTQNIQVWRMGDWRSPIATLPSGYNSPQFSPNGRYLLSPNRGGTVIRIWSVARGWQEAASLRVVSPLNAFTAFDRRGRFLAIATGSKVFVRSTRGNWPLIASLALGGQVTTIAFSPDGATMTAGLASGVARVWDTRHWHEIARVSHMPLESSLAMLGDLAQIHDNSVTHIRYLDANTVTTVSRDGTMRLWRIPGRWSFRRWSLATHYTGHADPFFRGASDAGLSSDPDKVTVTWRDGAIDSWSVSHARRVATFSLHPLAQEVIQNVHRLPARVLQPLLRWRARTGWQGASGVTVTGTDPAFFIDQVAFTPNGKYLLTAGEINSSAVAACQCVEIWSTQTGDQVAIARRPAGIRNVIDALNVDPSDPDLMVTSDFDSRARVWHVSSGTLVKELPHEDAVGTAAFQPHGSMLATGDNSGAVHIWNGSHDWSQEAQILTNSNVAALAFSPDGRYLAGEDSDGVLRIWDGLDNWHQAAQFQVGNRGTTLAFSRDGRSLVTTDGNGLAQAWLWRPDDLVQATCARLNRNLTRNEWQLYIGAEPYRPTCPGLPTPSDNPKL